jgi:hypothetical protein
MVLDSDLDVVHVLLYDICSGYNHVTQCSFLGPVVNCCGDSEIKDNLFPAVYQRPPTVLNRAFLRVEKVFEWQ